LHLIIGGERYFLSVGIVVANEPLFVAEWARHYLAEGVEHFYVIDQEVRLLLGACR
jgi:hypothetical protein